MSQYNLLEIHRIVIQQKCKQTEILERASYESLAPNSSLVT